MVQLSINNAGRELIEEFEDFRAEMYYDSAGKPTIGFGTLITESNIHLMTAKVNKAEARQLMNDHIKDDARAIQSYIHTKLNQDQVNALHSFVYNLGRGALRDSTLRKRINAGASMEEIKYQFSRWNKETKNGKKVASRGLTRRRAKEAALYAGEMDPEKKKQ